MLELSLLDSSWFKLAYDGLEREFKFFNQLEGDGVHREIKEDPATANMSGSNCSRCGVGGGPMCREVIWFGEPCICADPLPRPKARNESVF